MIVGSAFHGPPDMPALLRLIVQMVLEDAAPTKPKLFSGSWPKRISKGINPSSPKSIDC